MAIRLERMFSVEPGRMPVIPAISDVVTRIGRTSAGHHERNWIYCQSPFVTRRHCFVVYRDGHFFIQDERVSGRTDRRDFTIWGDVQITTTTTANTPFAKKKLKSCKKHFA